MGLGFSAFALVMVPEEAKAYNNDYCREYTRTVYIGNRAQEAYGTACQQSDGSWMIVGEGLGNDIPDNASNVNYVIRDNARYITPPRVTYYTSPRVVYRNQPSFVWYNSGHYRNGHHVVYKKPKYVVHKNHYRGNDRDWHRHHNRDRYQERHHGRD